MQPVMTLLFIKRLNDTFEENAEKLIKEGKSQKSLTKARIGITFSSQMTQDGQFYRLQRKEVQLRSTHK